MQLQASALFYTQNSKLTCPLPKENKKANTIMLDSVIVFAENLLLNY